MVSKSQLGDLDYLNEGSFGKVYKVPDFRLRGDAMPLAYKEFTGDKAILAKSRSAARLVVDFRTALTADERAELDQYYMWPRELVEDDASREICGFVMPLIPEECFWPSGTLADQPRTMEWLAASDRLLSVNQVSLDASENDRLYLAAQWVYAVAWLHRRGWVFGDLSFKNAAFALTPPRVVLFDCDAAAALTDLSRKQENTPFWDPPELGPAKPHRLQDTATDVYKLGLAIIRSMKGKKSAIQSRWVGRLDGILDAEGIDLVGQALSEDPDERPSAKELYLYLRQFTAPRMVRPTIAGAELATPLLPRGADARIFWRIENAQDVEIRVGHGSAQKATTVKWADNQNGCLFRVTEAGPVSITATNPYGTAALELGDVMLYELPSFSVTIGDLPHPAIPPVSSISLEPITRQLPTGVGSMPDTPRIPSPEPYEMLRVMAANRIVTPPWPRIDDAVAEGARSILELIRTGSDGYLAALRTQTAESGNG